MAEDEYNNAPCPPGREPVAILGFSFQFGGGAVSSDSFWDMLVEEGLHEHELETLPVKHGNFIQEDISAFDAPFFGIKPAEAAAMDPQSRKLLEATYRALENAGTPLEMAMGTKTCVFTGISSDDYRLMGPSDMGIVGGANLWLTPESMLPLAHLNFLSPDSTCYSFDHRANGYTRGDGYGVLVLKPLSKARAARDPIRAIIRSTASNENGRTTGGITKVSFGAQRAMIETAYRNANLDPALTRYVEAHAPGTEGDGVEASALAAVFSKHRSMDDPLCMGSVKANLGHLEGASGIASLIKVILMLEKGIIPRLANFEHLHPRIRGDEWHMAFPTTSVSWPSGIRLASINFFRFGGANAHAVLHSERLSRPQRESSQNTRSAPTHPRLLVVSAAVAAATDRTVSALHHYLEEGKPLDLAKLQSIAYTLAHRRSRLPWKKAVVLSADTLSITNSPTAIRSMQEPVVVFVFTGQGVQWAQTGTQFLYNKPFRTSLERSSEYLRELGATWDAIEELSIEASGSRISDATRAQPLCTAIQIALVDMLRSHGIRPAYCIGHSSGEIACAYLTGALSARSACQVAYHRGQIIARSFPEPGKYGMLAVGLSATEVTGYLSRLDAQVETPVVSIACYNSSRNITLSGERAQLEILHGMFQAQSVFSRLLSVQAPYHTPILAHVAREYEMLLQGLASEPQPDYSTVMVSSVTSQPISPDELRTAAYWAKNLSAPVQFEIALQTLLSTALPPTSDQAKTTMACIIEIGPHAALRAPVKAHDDCRDLPYFRCPVDLMSVNGILEDQVACLSDLPQYPLNHSRRYWHESSISKSNRFRKYARHDFLGQRVLDWAPHAPRWRNCIRKLENPWIEDHKLGGALIYPGAGMLVMAIEAAAQYVQDQGHHVISAFQLKDVTLMSALNLTDSHEGTTTELSLDPSAEQLGRSSLPKHFAFKLFVLEGETWRQNTVLGIEAAGIVTEAGVATDLRLGDRVAVLTDGTFRSSINADYRTALKLPNEVSLRDAASLTGTACTVYRAFVDIAQLQLGERVLIHAGAGATGQMAIQLASHLGAEVFVTVSSNTKRQLIQNVYGIKPSNIFSSRDISFVNGIKRLTGGQRVDVVLNSLTGELLASAWAGVVAPFGRWVEIGKRDMIDNNSLAMRPFLNNVCFSCIDLTGIWRQRAALMRRLLTSVFALVTDGVFHAPKPLAEFGVHQIQAAFRRLQSNKDGGKIIDDMEAEKEVTVQQPPTHSWNFRGDRTYLLAGGLGGLGREIARWMVRRGVRFLVVLSKSEPGKDETRLMLLDDLRAAGCKVAAMMCDIANKDALEAAMTECSTKLPPIAGCIQASMVLRDKYFSAMTINDWIECTAPKIEGTAHLDQLLPTGQDCFIMLSSVVGVIGAVGQSNYAAGCAFQDAIARHRVMRGEKAISLDLGMIVDQGAVAEDDALARTMSSFGHYQPMTMDHLERLLERYCDPRLPLLHEDDCQIVCGIRSPAVVRAQGFKLPAWADMPLFESLHDLKVDTAQVPRDTVRRSCHDLLIGATSKQEAVNIVVTALLDKISDLLDVPPANINCTQPVHFFGVDSMIATELQNWFADQVRADVPILHILGNNSVDALATIAVESRIPVRMPQ
ncbi:Type I Iterative PKS [Elasticomyces elasticus]|nr:Type I Iterative PKS [Elasticomyces elasticus]